MDLELLQSFSLVVSQVRTVETVLRMIVDGLVERAGLALARTWLIGPGDICAACSMGHECPSARAASIWRPSLVARKWMAESRRA